MSAVRKPQLKVALERRAIPRPANDDNYAEAVVGGIKTACVTRAQLANLMVNDCFSARRARRAPKLVFASNGHTIALPRPMRNSARGSTPPISSMPTASRW